MKQFFVAAAVLGTILCTASVFLGLCAAIEASTMFSYAICGVGAMLVVGLLGSTRDIWSGNNPLYTSLRFFWLLAVLITFVGILLAAGNHALLRNPVTQSVNVEWNQLYESSKLQWGGVFILALFFTGCPVVLSNFRAILEEEESAPSKNQ
jgi:putative copper export protein